jgi:hypothetical protein
MPVMPGRRLRAPQQDGAVFAEPALEEARRLLSAAPTFSDVSIAGRRLLELRRQAIQAAVETAHAYLHAAGQGASWPNTGRVLAAGHQPEIFHPGVWVKNFALNGIARAAGLVPLNLVVDNDNIKSTSLTVPTWPAGEAREPAGYRLEKIPFEDWPGDMPYEECKVRDEELFASLPARAERWTGSWGFKPLLGEYWVEVMRHRDRTPLLGERLVAGRRALERRWGCANLEVPVSRLCETEPFAWFLAHIFAEADHFHAAYNDVVRAYRQANGLRSRSHPVPDLEADGDWRELPLWAWKGGGHRRGRLFVRSSVDGFALRADRELWPALPPSGLAFVEAWRALVRQGFKLRSRALITTLYTRLFVADSFIHGIGGGKYDELTDEIIRRFFQVEPPRFMVLSATLLLPLKGFEATPKLERGLRHRLRDLQWNPQRYLPPGSPGMSLARARADLLGRDPALPPMGAERHRSLRRFTAELVPLVAGAIADTEAAVATAQGELRANAVLRRRDCAFCLYPEELLRPFCQQFLGKG